MKKITFLILFGFIAIADTYAQPANNACSGAQVVTPDGTCVAGTTVGATDSWTGSVGCQSGNNPEVWYSFVSTGSQANFTITSGTLTGNIELVLVESTGPCTGLTLTGSTCGPSVLNATINGLQIGVTYYYTISSSTGSQGTFTTCVATTTPPPVSGQDCVSAAILCDNSTFSQASSSAGFGIQEVTTSNSCWGSGGERQSKWFKFTVGCSGTLEFNITPVVSTDDYDWAIWNVTSLGCPTTTNTTHDAIACNWSGCDGSTGLSSCANMCSSEPGALDCTGNPACDPYAFVNTTTASYTPITVTAGNTYALLVDNFAATNNGFTLTFGGACGGGTAVLGPDAGFSFTSPSCGAYNFTKTCQTTNSTFLWIFGDGTTSTLQNPSHTYVTSGTFIVSLSVTDAIGCTNTSSQTIVIGIPPSNAGADITICSGATGNLGTPTTVGYTYSWSPTTGLSSSTISDPTVTLTNLTSSPVSTTYTVTTTSSGCSSTDAVVVTVNPAPTVSNAGPDQSVCGTTATLAGNTATVGTGTWTLISGTGTITTPSSPTSGVTGLGVGANVFQWTITNTPCPPSTDQVTITVVASPTVAAAGLDQTVCGTTATLAGNTATTGTGTWTLISGTGTITTPSSPTSGITGLGVGANVFQWTITNAPCPPSTDQVTITGVASPTVAAAGPDQTVCGTTATLAGNTATAGTGTWTLISGTGTITTPSSPTSGVTGLGVGANVFQWTITNAPCPPSTDQVTITGVASPTVAAAGPDQTVCGTTATLAGNTATTGTGTWTLISGTGTITNPSSPTSGVTGLGVGANVFQWTITNAPCPVSSDQVTITGVASPTVAAAGPDQTVCGTTATLAGNTATAGTGTWTLVSGTGTITTPSSPTSGITGLGVGANVFQWTITNAPCPPTSDQVTITGVASPTVAAAGPDQTVCGTTATLAGNTATVGTGTWTLVSGTGTITTPSSPTSGITGLGVGANVFQWTIANTPCPASSDQVTITGVASPTVAAAGPDQTVCGTTATLAGNTGTAGTGTWTLISGTGTITTPSSPTSGVTGLGVGTNVFQWTITNAPCPPSSDQVTITGVASPTVSAAGPDQSVCGTTATLAGNTATAGAGTWTLVSGSGTITTPSSPTSGITGLGVGANVFEWTITNAPCPPSSDQVTITGVNNPTVANAGPDQTLCGSTTTLAGNTATVGTGTWTLVSGTGTITTPSSPTSGITGMATGSNVFEWTITNAPCPSTSDQVTITITSTPTVAAAGPDQTVCSNTATLAGNTAVVGTGSWALISGTGTITTPSSPTSGITGLGVGPNVFEWTISSPPCNPTSDQVTITGVASPTVAAAGPDQTVCDTVATLAGNAATVGTGTWTLISGAGTITSPSSPTSGITGLGVGPNVFEWTITNAPCPPTSDQVTITGVASPTVAAAGPDQTVCDTVATLAGNTATAGSGTWTLISGTGTITSPSSPTSGITGLGVGPNVFEWTITNAPCPPTTDQVIITGVASPTVAAAGPDQTVCDTVATLAGNAAITGNGTWTLISGVGTITSPSSPTSGITGLGVGPNVFEWTITNAPCPPTSDQVTITGVASPTVAAAGPDQTVCATTATLAGNTVTAGSGTWTLVSGTGTITTPSSPTSGVTGLGTGANVFEWTITNAPCPATTDQVTITANPMLAPLTSNDTICPGNNAILTATSSLGGNFEWYDSASGGTLLGTSSTFTTPVLNTTTTYYVQTSLSGCTSDIIPVTVFVNPVISSFTASPDAGTLPLSVSFTNNSTGGLSYLWLFGDGDSATTANASHIYTTEGTYTALLIVYNGLCTDTFSVDIEVTGLSAIIVPNVFSPNGDGKNDLFKVDANNLISLEVTIFNRWGTKVFAWTGVDNGWDGRTTDGVESTNGTYYYILKAEGADGKSYDLTGYLMLLK